MSDSAIDFEDMSRSVAADARVLGVPEWEIWHARAFDIAREYGAPEVARVEDELVRVGDARSAAAVRHASLRVNATYLFACGFDSDVVMDELGLYPSADEVTEMAERVQALLAAEEAVKARAGA